MATAHASLDAAATERKSRLAKLKSLKRKQPDNPTDEGDAQVPRDQTTTSKSLTAPTSNPTYLSGRNYDPVTRGPKLGFESAPTEDAETLEDRAAQIALETKQIEEREERDEKPIDLFKLQPKKPNWDLKRDVARKMERLNAQTENAIARLVRERIEGARQKKRLVPDAAGAEEVGMNGEELVEGVHIREREEQEENRREKEDDLG